MEDNMLDQHAIECDKAAEAIGEDVSSTLADITSGGINEKSMIHVKNALALGVARTISSVYPLAEQEMQRGLKEYARRSFGMMDPVFRVNLAEFYSRYIPVMAANLSVRSFLNIQNTIRRGEAEGKSEKEIVEEISKTYSGVRGGGRIIVRTEGTRAVSLARRAVAQRQAARGNAPDFYIYRSLMDTRTTKTCNALHNTYWSYEDDDFSYWPPRHFSCRAGVVYGWNGMLLSDSKMIPLTPSRRQKIRAIQQKEFPKWTDFQGDVLIRPEESAADALSGRNVIRDEIDLQNALRESRIPTLGTRKNKALMNKVKEMTDSSRKGDKIVMSDVLRELEKIK
jgi:SPP1 gp7 family putative phage head morphogenesis protein